MRTFKSAEGLSNWLLRLTLVGFILVFHFKLVTDFKNYDPFSYLAAVYVLFGVLLLIGGFLRKSSLTVFSGLILFLLSAFILVKMIVYYFQANINVLDTASGGELLVYLMSTSISLYFLAKGNKG
jgi:hypothetical protein